jgi:hypothetical protein
VSAPVFDLVRVPYGYNRGRPIAAAGADRIIDSIAAVARSLEAERAAA